MTAIAFTAIAIVFYIPAGYYLEMTLYRRRQRKLAAAKATTMINVHVRRRRCRRTASSCAGELSTALIVNPGDQPERILKAVNDPDREGRGDPHNPLSLRSRGCDRPRHQSDRGALYCPELETRCWPTWCLRPLPRDRASSSYDADTPSPGRACGAGGIEIDVMSLPVTARVTSRTRSRPRTRSSRRRPFPGSVGRSISPEVIGPRCWPRSRR